MTHVVTDECVKCKYTDCVEVCPVDCFHEGEHMLVINPDECIDCGVCIPWCPVDAIQLESPDLIKWIEINKQHSEEWPVITQLKPAPPDAEKYKDETGKYEKYIESIKKA